MSSNTTMKVAARMVRTAAKSRPATSGNKNLQSRARPQGAPMRGGVTAPIKGPDKGTG